VTRPEYAVGDTVMALAYGSQAWSGPEPAVVVAVTYDAVTVRYADGLVQELPRARVQPREANG